MRAPSLNKARVEHLGHAIRVSQGLYKVTAGFGHYRCLHCGQVWALALRIGGHRPRDWWKCPNGCNAMLEVR